MTFLAPRLSSFYIAIFFVIGCMMPYWPVWLQARGMTGVEIGILTAIPILGKVIFSPLFASLGDKLGERKRLMLLFLVSSFFCFALFFFAHNFYTLFVISFLYGISWAPLMSFGDNLTLLATREGKIQYGRLRLWGSISFIVMSFGFGFVLEGRDVAIIYWAILGAIALTFIATLGLPDVRAMPLGRTGSPVRTLLKDKTFQIFMATVACIHGSHALYYGFATLHWRAQGYSDAFIGFLWAEGVIAEVVFFIFGGRIGTRFTAASLLIFAAIACVVRWSVLANDPDVIVLCLVQTLHALTFGAMHLGAMNFISRTVCIDFSATAQSLYGASAFGVGAGLSLLFVGYFYELFSGGAFFIMTLLGIFGTLCALVLRQREKCHILA